jgi:hypothetical protein
MSAAVPEHTTTDVTNCDREPIHIPGAILPHGAMLVLDGVTLEILQVAGDVTGLLGASVEELLDHSAEAIFRPQQIENLRALSANLSLLKPRHLLDPQMRVAADIPLDASLHRSNGALVLEFEAADASERFAADPLAAVQEMVEGLDAAGSLVDLCQMAAERVRDVAAYDRVLVYRFMQDGSGRRHPKAGTRPLRQEWVAAHHASQLRTRASRAAKQPPDRQTARHEPSDLARRVADPSGIPAEHGNRRLHVDFHHQWRRVVGLDCLSSLRSALPAAASARRVRAVRVDVFLSA